MSSAGTLSGFKIPLNPNAQSFTTVLNGVEYGLTFKWNGDYDGWTLDIDDVNNDPLVHGIGLMTGADLLEQYQYLGFNGALVVINNSNPDAPPGYADLGVSCQLYFVTN